MTSMPASRRARAMIFAPRSWPSKPGLAITMRIFRLALIGGVNEWFMPSCEASWPRRQVYGGATDRYRLFSGLAEPRQRPVRLPRRGSREAPPRLRSRRTGSPARRAGHAGCDLHHALASRPQRRSDSLGVAERLQPRSREEPSRALVAAGKRQRVRDLRLVLGRTADVGARLRAAGVRAGRAVRGCWVHHRGDPTSALHDASVRLPRP